MGLNQGFTPYLRDFDLTGIEWLHPTPQGFHNKTHGFYFMAHGYHSISSVFHFKIQVISLTLRFDSTTLRFYSTTLTFYTTTKHFTSKHWDLTAKILLHKTGFQSTTQGNFLFLNQSNLLLKQGVLLNKLVILFHDPEILLYKHSNVSTNKVFYIKQRFLRPRDITPWHWESIPHYWCLT